MDIKSLLTGTLHRSETAPASGQSRGPRADGDTAARAGTATATHGQSESVTLTQAAKALNDAGQGAPFDSARVASIKAAVDAGTYAIDTRQLAGRMLGFERQLAA